MCVLAPFMCVICACVVAWMKLHVRACVIKSAACFFVGGMVCDGGSQGRRMVLNHVFAHEEPMLLECHCTSQ